MKLLDIGMNFVSFLCSGKCINRCKMTADIVNQHPLVFILLYQCAVIFCHIGFFLAEKLHLRVFLLAFLIVLVDAKYQKVEEQKSAGADGNQPVYFITISKSKRNTDGNQWYGEEEKI